MLLNKGMQGYASTHVCARVYEVMRERRRKKYCDVFGNVISRICFWFCIYFVDPVVFVLCASVSR